MVAGLSLLWRQGWVHSIGAALGDTEEESNMVGELCSQFDGFEDAISLDQPGERLARLSALFSSPSHLVFLLESQTSTVGVS